MQNSIAKKWSQSKPCCLDPVSLRLRVDISDRLSILQNQYSVSRNQMLNDLIDIGLDVFNSIESNKLQVDSN